MNFLLLFLLQITDITISVVLLDVSQYYEFSSPADQILKNI